MPKALTCPVILTSASTRADNSLGLRFATCELSPADMTAFFEIRNLNLKMLLQPVDSEPEALHEVKGDLNEKTPSERLRAVLFVFWKQQGEQGEFHDFYRIHMEKLINFVKAKLQPE